MDKPLRSFARSLQAYERAKKTLPGGVGGNARSAEAGWRPHPIFMAYGQGSHIYDVDGNDYIDYLAAFGPLILGHKPQTVLQAVKRVLDDMGSMLGAPHLLETKTAELAAAAVPCWEQVRFANTGSEAVMASLRIARAYTGRPKILRFEGHFHGQGDVIHWSAKPPLDKAGPERSPSPTPGSAGIPDVLAQTLIVRPWNDAQILEDTIGEHWHEIAAVICEPVMANCTVIPPRPGYLELLRRLTAEKGIVLIFDEVKTGFRLALGGAQEHYGVTPDLSVAAKALAAGFPVAAVGGRRDLMDVITQNRVIQSATYHTNPVSMAATYATLKELNRPGLYQELFAAAERLQGGLQVAARELGVPTVIQGVGPVFQILFADRPVHNYREVVAHTRPEQYARFWSAMLERGVYFNPVQQECWFVSTAHTEEDVQATVERAREALAPLCKSGAS